MTPTSNVPISTSHPRTKAPRSCSVSHYRVPSRPTQGRCKRDKLEGSGLVTPTGLLWIAQGPEATTNLQRWAQKIVKRFTPVGTPTAKEPPPFQIDSGRTRLRTTIRTSQLTDLKDILQDSIIWPIPQIISRTIFMIKTHVQDCFP